MAADPIFPDEFEAILARFYARITMQNEGRIEGLMNILYVLQLDLKEFKTETLERFDRIEGQVAIAQADIVTLKADMATAKEDIATAKEDIAALRRDVTNIIAFQHTLMDTFKGFATDVLNQMAAMRQEMAAMQQEMRDGFAAQAERHNELMLRVERLERRDNPPRN
jgi:DNA-binding FrmR family transcriptional regulator